MAEVKFDDFHFDQICAEPTSRVLDGSRDHGSSEEWAQAGWIEINGKKRKANMIFLFDEQDTEDSDPANWPWDDKAARIVLDQDQ